MHSEGRSASGPVFIRGSPLFGHFHTVYITSFAYLVARFIILRPLFSHFYTPIFAYLVARWIMFRLIRVQHFSVGTMGVSPLQNMHPEVSSVSRPMFIRGSFLFGHFYTVIALILAYLVARGIMFRLRGCNIFHSALWGCHPYKTCTLRDVRYQAPCLSGVPPYLWTFSLLQPQFCILSHTHV